MTFLELFYQMQEDRQTFYFEDIRVTITEVTDLDESVRMPASMKNADPGGFNQPGESRLRKWRVTYNVGGEDITNYVTAQNMQEARRMVWEYLRDRLSPEGKRPSRELAQKILRAAQNTEIVPLGGFAGPRGRDLDREWSELERLFRYSMQHDYKIFPKGYATNPKQFKDFAKFGSLDNEDFQHLFRFFSDHPDFAHQKLAVLDHNLRAYMKMAYNYVASSYKDPKERRWTDQFRDVFQQRRKALKDIFGRYRIRRPADVPGVEPGGGFQPPPSP